MRLLPMTFIGIVGLGVLFDELAIDDDDGLRTGGGRRG